MNDPTILRVEGLTGGYGAVTILRDVGIEVREGEIVAILGSNGAGKSTLLKTLSGLLAPRRGRIELAGRSIGGASPERIARAGLVLVPEGRELFPPMTVRDHLTLGAYQHRRDRAGRARRLANVLELFPVLAERMDAAAEELSGGQQQMLAIGRGLMADPKVLLLDEPSLGLAPLVLKEVFDVVDRLRQAGITTVIVEQNAAMTLRLADRGYVLDHGRIVLADAADALLDDPRVRSAYLGLGATPVRDAVAHEDTGGEKT